MSDEKPEIALRENGPLIAKNVAVFVLPDGSESEAKPMHALCRCGHSKNKPYCDGSHKDAGFKGESQDVRARDKVYTYEADGIRVSYNKLLCSHAGECNTRAASVFDPAKKPWVQFGANDLEKLREVGCSLPIRRAQPRA